MPTVALSAGHGAGDVGAVYGGLREADLTVKIASRAAEMIRKHGVGVLYVPDNVTLQGTINWINARGSQITLCVDVHINSGGGTGVEGWHNTGLGQSSVLARYLADACAAETGLRNRGIKDHRTSRHGRLGFVADTTPLAALIECGFIDGDNAFLKSDANLTRMAKGVARGCLSYLKVPWNPALLSGSTPAPQPDLEKAKALLWDGDAWWSSLWRVKEMRKHLPK